MSSPLPKALRMGILDSARDSKGRVRCARCGKPFADSDIQVDHIHPEAEGGGHDPVNLQPLCAPKKGGGCHRLKSREEAKQRARMARKAERNLLRIPMSVLGIATGAWGLGYAVTDFTGQQETYLHNSHAVGTVVIVAGLGFSAAYALAHLRLVPEGQEDKKKPAEAEDGTLVVIQARALEAAREVMGDKGSIVVTVIDRDTFDVSYKGTGFASHNDTKRDELRAAMQAKIGDRWRTQWRTEFDTVQFTRRPALPKRIDHPGFEKGRDWWKLPVAPGCTVNLKTTSHVLVIGRTNMGKALALDTPIPTPKGWATMGELVDGQEVFDENGKPCRVVHAHEVRNDRACYRVAFSDGSTIVADAEHNWLTTTTRERKNGKPGQVRTTEQIRDSLVGRADGAWNHAVPLAGALDFPAQELPLDPYLMGAWLGDGASGKAEIYVGTQDFDFMVGEIGKVARVGTVRKDPRGEVSSIRFSVSVTRDGVESRLRKLGAWKNKHIPQVYLTSSIEQRRALLSGLFDTDGNAIGSAVEYTSTSKPLAQGVLALARGLGYKATMRSKQVKGKTEASSTAYIIRFTAHNEVFRMPRKLQAQGIAKVDGKSRRRSIVAVDPVESVPVRCITVDSPSSLYLAGDACIPTHNTALMRALIAAGTDSASREEAELLLMDPKRVELVGFRDWPGVRKVLTTDEALWDAAIDLRDEMDERHRLYEEEGVPLSSHQPILVVIDEFEQYVIRMNDRWINTPGLKKPGQKVAPPVQAIASLLSMARKCNIHLIIGTQRPDAAWFGGTARDNLAARIGVGPLSASAQKMLWGEGHSDVGKDIPDTAKGRATVQLGDGEYEEIQTYWVADPGDSDGNNTDEDWKVLRRLGMPARG